MPRNIDIDTVLLLCEDKKKKESLTKQKQKRGENMTVNRVSDQNAAVVKNASAGH